MSDPSCLKSHIHTLVGSTTSRHFICDDSFSNAESHIPEESMYGILCSPAQSQFLLPFKNPLQASGEEREPKTKKRRNKRPPSLEDSLFSLAHSLLSSVGVKTAYKSHYKMPAMSVCANALASPAISCMPSGTRRATLTTH